MRLKAFVVFLGDSPYDYGCLLVYAHNANQARHLGKDPFEDYESIKAWRRPEFDQYCEYEAPYRVETNRELPEGAPPFYDGKEVAIL